MSKKPNKKVEEKPPEPEPEPEPEPVFEEVKPTYNENQQRVLFQKLPIKKIVSYHSGTILADNEPKIEISDEKYQQILKVFDSHANTDGLVSSDSLPDILIQLNNQDIYYDKDYLKTIITKMLQKTLEEYPLPPPPEDTTITTEQKQVEVDPNQQPQQTEPKPILLPQSFFIQFYLKFAAPSYYYGQRLRLYAARGELDNIKELIYRGCNLNTSNGEGLSSLHYACENNQIKVIDLLISLATPPGDNQMMNTQLLNINAQDKYGWTPLHTSCHHGTTLCVQRLLSMKGIVDVHVVNNVGKTALHLAAAQNRAQMVTWLLQAGNSINHQDKRGMTVIHEVAYRGHLPLYQELVRDKAADLTIRDAMGKLAADYWDESLPTPPL